MTLRVLSGGAAEGLIAAIAGPFEAATGARIEGTFGAVGAMRDTLLSGAPADVMILTEALIDDLERQGLLFAGSKTPIGIVKTGIAVRRRDAAPAVAGADDLRHALTTADAIYFPDPKLATAGIHFAKVLAGLGIADTVAGRLRTFPNGAAAMRALAAAEGGRPIGCTQVTEIRNTPGLTLVGPLPPGFGLETVYAAGVCASSANHEMARHLTRLLANAANRPIRERLGFEPLGS